MFLFFVPLWCSSVQEKRVDNKGLEISVRDNDTSQQSEERTRECTPLLHIPKRQRVYVMELQGECSTGTRDGADGEAPQNTRIGRGGESILWALWDSLPWSSGQSRPLPPQKTISLVSKSHWPMRGRANSQWKVANVKLKKNGQLSLKVETGNLCGFNMEKSLCKFNN